MVYRADLPDANRDIFVVARDSGAKPVPIATSRFDEKNLARSPDGQWLAYASNETGVNEVYIARLDAPTQRWPVSQRGGNEPRWSKTGEIFFRRGDSVFVRQGIARRGAHHLPAHLAFRRAVRCEPLERRVGRLTRRTAVRRDAQCRC